MQHSRTSNIILIKLARIGRLRMLRGLPFSNVLGLWSGHSCSSPSGSSPPGSSCSWVFSCSSGPTSFSCEAVWCMCAHEWSARCLGCNAFAMLMQVKMEDYDMVHMWHRWLILQGSQHHPRAWSQIKYLLHSLLQMVFRVNQQTNMMLQRYTKHPFIPFNLCITIHTLF